MTAQDTGFQPYANLENLLVALLERVGDGQQREITRGRKWLRPAVQDIINLPWNETGLPDGRKPPSPAAAAELVLLMVRVLDDGAPPPNSINPTGDGGVTAQWRLPGYGLEIFCEPGEPPDYFVRTAVLEHEGLVEENPELFRTHLGLMPRESRT